MAKTKLGAKQLEALRRLKNGPKRWRDFSEDKKIRNSLDEKGLVEHYMDGLQGSCYRLTRAGHEVVDNTDSSVARDGNILRDADQASYPPAKEEALFNATITRFVVELGLRGSDYTAVFAFLGNRRFSIPVNVIATMQSGFLTNPDNTQYVLWFEDSADGKCYKVVEHIMRLGNIPWDEWNGYHK